VVSEGKCPLHAHFLSIDNEWQQTMTTYDMVNVHFPGALPLTHTPTHWVNGFFSTFRPPTDPLMCRSTHHSRISKWTPCIVHPFSTSTPVTIPTVHHFDSFCHAIMMDNAGLLPLPLKVVLLAGCILPLCGQKSVNFCAHCAHAGGMMITLETCASHLEGMCLGNVWQAWFKAPCIST